MVPIQRLVQVFVIALTKIERRILLIGVVIYVGNPKRLDRNPTDAEQQLTHE